MVGPPMKRNADPIKHFLRVMGLLAFILAALVTAVVQLFSRG